MLLANSVALPYLALFFFFFNDTATTEISTLPLHDALPISVSHEPASRREIGGPGPTPRSHRRDRKSTRLNSSHLVISYAVFCLKKKKKNTDKDIRKVLDSREAYRYGRQHRS